MKQARFHQRLRPQWPRQSKLQTPSIAKVATMHATQVTFTKFTYNCSYLCSSPMAALLCPATQRSSSNSSNSAIFCVSNSNFCVSNSSFCVKDTNSHVELYVQHSSYSRALACGTTFRSSSSSTFDDENEPTTMSHWTTNGSLERRQSDIFYGVISC
jgi:hypothetical protein